MYFTIGMRLYTLKSDLGTISWLGEVEIFSYNAVRLWKEWGPVIITVNMVAES